MNASIADSITPPKRVQTSPRNESPAQFSSYHDQLSNIGMRIRQSVDMKYRPTNDMASVGNIGLTNYQSMVVPTYKRSELPENLNVPMLVNQRTMSSSASNLDSMFNQQQQQPMETIPDAGNNKRRRDDF